MRGRKKTFFPSTWLCSCRGDHNSDRAAAAAAEAVVAAGKGRLLGFGQLCQRGSDSNTLCTLSSIFFFPFALSDLEVVASCSYPSLGNLTFPPFLLSLPLLTPLQPTASLKMESISVFLIRGRLINPKPFIFISEGQGVNEIHYPPSIS